MNKERFESRINQVILLVFTVIGIGLGLSLFQIAFEKVLPELPKTHYLGFLAVAVILVLILLALSIRIILPPMKVTRNVYCKLLFNEETRRFINPGWYLSWYPVQMGAEQAIRSSAELDLDSTNDYTSALLSTSETETNQFIEYLLIYWLKRSSLIMYALGVPQRLHFEQFPCWLKDNFFLKKFHESESKEFKHLKDITLNIPDGFKLVSYSGGNINLSRERLLISIASKRISIFPIRHMLNDQNSITIADIPLKKDFEQDLTKDLSSLTVVNIVIEFSISYSRVQGIFRRQEFLQLENWSSDLLDNFAKFFDVYENIHIQK